MRAPRAPRHCGFRTLTGPRVLAFVALSTLLALAGGSARSATAAGSQAPPVVPGELIVGFERGSSQAQQNAAVAQSGGARSASFPQIRAVLVRVPPSLTAVATKLLLGLPQVRYVEPNHVVKTAETTPDDPSFGQLWGLHNTGQTGGTADADIDAPEAWDVSTTGSSDVVVGVIDTGVDFAHPDLAQQQWVNTGENCGSTDPAAACAERTNGVDDDGNGYVDDWRGWDFVNDDNDPFDDNRHGTHVSGTIGAVGDNGVGVAGVNWNVKIMALKFLNAAGSGTTADAVAATLYAADKGAHVSSNSWGGGPFDQSLLDAIEYGASRGMLFVAAAGNDGRNNDTTPTYPSNYASEAIVSVAATDHTDALAFFSNYGATTVDLAAPGVNILSTTPGNTYASLSGTSMATPHVAGVAALLKARYPDASVYGLKALLLRSVDPVAQLERSVVTGGRLNAFNAVSCSDTPKVWLGSPSSGFVTGIGDVLQLHVLGSNCATPAGLGNVAVTVNGSPVALTAGSPDRGLYRGTYTVGAAGPLTVVASVSAGGSTATHTVSGAAFLNYTCQDVPLAWVDVTPGTRLSGVGDDTFSTLNIGFPVTYFGQTYSTAYVSSNGFLALGSSSGANAHLNAAVPGTAAPNGFVSPFWDDLNPGAGGAVYAGVTGAAPNRTLHVEWFNVPHFSLSGSGTVTFELSLKENGDVSFQYLDTDFGNATWNAGASATAGVERAGRRGRPAGVLQPAAADERARRELRAGHSAAATAPAAADHDDDAARRQVGVAYSQTLAATSGTPPYMWSLDSGSLPPGLEPRLCNGRRVGYADEPPARSRSPRRSPTAARRRRTRRRWRSRSRRRPLVVTTTSLPGGRGRRRLLAGAGGDGRDSALCVVARGWRASRRADAERRDGCRQRTPTTGRCQLVHGRGGRRRHPVRLAAALDHSHGADAGHRIPERDYAHDGHAPLRDCGEPRARTTTRTSSSTRTRRARERPTGTARSPGSRTRSRISAWAIRGRTRSRAHRSSTSGGGRRARGGAELADGRDDRGRARESRAQRQRGELRERLERGRRGARPRPLPEVVALVLHERRPDADLVRPPVDPATPRRRPAPLAVRQRFDQRVTRRSRPRSSRT